MSIKVLTCLLTYLQF